MQVLLNSFDLVCDVISFTTTTTTTTTTTKK
jgi:hypothetical protein